MTQADKLRGFVKKEIFFKRAFNFRSLLAITTISFALLTLLAKQYDYFKLDLTLTLLIQQLDQVWFLLFMRFVSFIGDVFPVLIIVTLLAIYGFLIGKRKAPVMLVISTIGGLAISQLFKLLVARPRPDPQLINQIGRFFETDSFPSGHVLGAISLYGFLLYISYAQLKESMIRKILIIICLFAILFMGLSRIYLGAHWFSDVLGAYLIGFVWLSAVVFFYHKLKPKVQPE